MLCFVFAQRKRMQAYKFKSKEKENFYRYACAYACINPFSRLNKRSYACACSWACACVANENQAVISLVI